jgi:hypothetical protein
MARRLTGCCRVTAGSGDLERPGVGGKRGIRLDGGRGVSTGACHDHTVIPSPRWRIVRAVEKGCSIPQGTVRYEAGPSVAVKLMRLRGEPARRPRSGSALPAGRRSIRNRTCLGSPCATLPRGLCDARSSRPMVSNRGPDLSRIERLSPSSRRLCAEQECAPR